MTRLQGLAVGAVLGLLIIASVVLLWNDRDAPAFVVVPSDAEATIAVHVTGAVATPGVVLVPGGARLVDVIEAAGGLDATADTNQLNLAARVGDAQRVEIPNISATPMPTTVDHESTAETITLETPVSELSEDPASSRINLNTADAERLEELPSIGPVLAQRIVAYRDQNGPFASIEDLEAVPGISAGIIEELRPLVTVDG